MTARRYGRLGFDSSNEDKVLFPDDGITKGDLIDYYERIAGHMLPHLRGRPLVMQRFPDGIAEGGFYHKQVPDHFPEWIDRVTVKKESGSQDLVVAENEATLAYLADQACITVHPWLSRRDRVRRPDLLVLDLDPPGDDFEPVRHAALACRDLLDELGVTSFVKTTGSRGLHVVVPLDASRDFDDVRGFAKRFAQRLVDRHPDRFTVEQRKDKRGNRVYLDVGRNAYAQTAVAPYAVRARPGAPVAVPLAWHEVETGKIRNGDAYTVKTVFRRLGQIEDPWAGMFRHRRSLEGPARALAEGSG